MLYKCHTKACQPIPDVWRDNNCVPSQSCCTRPVAETQKPCQTLSYPMYPWLYCVTCMESAWCCHNVEWDCAQIHQERCICVDQSSHKVPRVNVSRQGWHMHIPQWATCKMWWTISSRSPDRRKGFWKTMTIFFWTISQARRVITYSIWSSHSISNSQWKHIVSNPCINYCQDLWASLSGPRLGFGNTCYKP